LSFYIRLGRLKVTEEKVYKIPESSVVDTDPGEQKLRTTIRKKLINLIHFLIA
jgi:hypothetical protein